MIYRPQFAYPPAPRGFRDEDFVFWFDPQSTPALHQVMPVGAEIPDIPLPLHRDAPFIWRGTKVFSTSPRMGARFRGPDGSLLSDDFQPVYQSFFPSGFLVTGWPPVAHEPEIACPLGAVIQFGLANLGPAIIDDAQVFVMLYGVKRWREVS
jgi:hypothetical protein